MVKMSADHSTVGSVEEEEDPEKAENASPPRCCPSENEGGDSPCCKWWISVVGNQGDDAETQYIPPQQCTSNFCHFRDPIPGEAVKAVESYLTLVAAICEHCNTAPTSITIVLCLLIQPVYFAPVILLSRWNVAEVNGVAHQLLHITGVALMLIPAFVVFQAILLLIYKARDSRIPKLIEEHRQAFFNLYGVELGCHLGSTTNQFSLWSDPSQEWLRRPLQPQQQSPSTKDPPEAFPPIYLSFLVPGDISTYDQVYQLRVKIDNWTLIQNPHREVVKIYLNLLLSMLSYSLLFAILHDFFGIIVARFGFWTIIYDLMFVVVVVGLYYLCSDKRSWRPNRIVVEILIRIAQMIPYNNQRHYYHLESTPGFSLQLKASPFPGHPDALCQRYQLVRPWDA